MIYYQPLQQQTNEAFAFGTSLLGMILVFGFLKSMVSSLQETEGEQSPQLLPQLKKTSKIVTVTCPICGREIEIPEYGRTTRSDALKRHIDLEHRSEGKDVARFQPQVLIEGGEMVPLKYQDIVGFLRDPLPEYSLLTWLPAVEVEGEKKIDLVMKQLKAGVEGIQDSYQFRIFLTTMAKFHDYSIGNLILIMLQKPDATRVAGFSTWKDLYRWVKKGEKGIAILAPCMPPKKKILEPSETETAQDEEETEIRPIYFKVVYVFDVSQTEGKPLPEFEVPPLTGQANEELLGQVLHLAESQGLEVSFESKTDQDPDIKGYYTGKTIWVRPEESRAQQLKTLLHEVAHYYSEGVFRIPRSDAETIAESVAFTIGAHYGFDTGARSFPYVAVWSKDKKVLETNLAAIRKVSEKIFDGLEQIIKKPVGVD
ncbi:LtrC-like protein [Dehalococcoides mccartyi CG4]|uniref:ArdC-like ssDNA-binding domain-containing protein n=1 Tax=Dehalococcoides mccartyi TaxID=61435 RepID=UPI0004E078B7|nr:ArdC-like ssDNA-binding domain-containing protein [Dehalococcoides mccartyi]AII59460.1 LtrC-like protein [Dehalococcoides mccartyi CG4]